MRLFVTLGALTISGALFAACGDDDSSSPGTGGSGGAGGHAGTGGSATAGAAGAAGAAGNGGTAGAAGTDNGGTGGAGTGGSGTGGTSSSTGGTSAEDPDAGDGDASTGDAGDAGPPCTGCMELSVDLNDNNQVAFFQKQFTAADLTGETVTFRIRALTLGDQLTATPFATDGNTEGGSDFTLGTVFTQLNAGNGFDDTETFIDVALDIDALGVANANFDTTDVIAVGVQFGSAGAFAVEGDAGVVVTPTTEVILLDSVTFSGGPVDDVTFTADEEGFAFAGFGQPATAIHH